MLSHRIIKFTPPPIQQRTGGVWPGGVFPRQLPTTQAELDAHLLRVPLKKGDWVYYSQRNIPLTSCAVSIVADVCTDVANLRPHNGNPKTYLLMQLTGTSEYARKPDYAFGRDPWSRWDDGVGMAVCTEEEYKALNDDFVQNYIKEYLPRAGQFVRG